MKDYTVTITVTASFQAANEDAAQERGQELADHITFDFACPKQLKCPRWFGGDLNQESVDVEED